MNEAVPEKLDLTSSQAVKNYVSWGNELAVARVGLISTNQSCLSWASSARRRRLAYDFCRWKFSRQFAHIYRSQRLNR